MSCGASRQSKWVLLDSAASAWSGPPANRPPHRLTRSAAAVASAGSGSCCGVMRLLRGWGQSRASASAWSRSATETAASALAVTSMIVSSPAMVPTTSGSRVWSMAEAR